MISPETSVLLVRTLAHFLWQGAAIAGVAFAGAFFLRGARARYATHLVALFLMAACPVITAAWLLKSSPFAREVTVRPSNAVFAVDPALLGQARNDDLPPFGGAEPAPTSSARSIAPPFDWTRFAPSLAITYGVGVAAMFLRLSLALAAGRRLRSISAPVTDRAILDLLSRQASALRLRLAPAIATSARVLVPSVIGVARPLILLPASVLSGLSAAQLEAVLTHELAHIRRYDPIFHLIQRLIEAALFFHPGVWLISRRLRVERENCCDDLVLSAGVSPEEYARALIRVSELCALDDAALQPALSLAAATRTSLLRRRIQRMLGIHSPAELRPPQAALILLAVLGLAVTASLARRPAAQVGASTQAATASPTTRGTYSVAVTVVDAETRAPVSGAAVTVNARNLRSSATTDGGGLALLDFGNGAPRIVALTVTCPHRPTTRVQLPWAPDQIGATAMRYTFPLESGHTIGGTVLDPEGRAVANAAVQVSISGEDGQGGPSPAGPFVSMWSVKLQADGAGRWTFDSAPKEWARCYVSATAEGFVALTSFVGDQLPDADLRAGKAVLTLSRGALLHGTVTNADGQPIAGATVSYDGGMEHPSCTSNSAGEFELPHVPARDLTILALAPGFGPTSMSIESGKLNEVQSIRMARARKAAIRVVNESGKPVQGATIFVESFGTSRVQGRFDPGRTDDQGRWSFDGGEQRLRISVIAAGFRRVDNMIVTPGEPEGTISLTKEVHIAGEVVDAETGKPIDNFRVVHANISGGDRALWQPNQRNTYSGGRYEVTLGDSATSYKLRIEADGYAPMTSPALDKSGTFDAKLARAKAIEGVVLTPDGAPAAGAKLAMWTPTSQVMINNGEFTAQTFGAKATADSAGRFAFAPVDEQYQLIVLHPSGYAEVPADALGASPQVRLQKWATISGTLKVGGKPAANETMTIMVIPTAGRPGAARAILHSTAFARTDADGHYEISFVPPGRGSIGREIKTGYMSTGHANSRQYELAAGETRTINFGGEGRPVTGRIVPDADVPRYTKIFIFTVSTKMTPMPLPSNWPGLSAEERSKWMTAWRASDEGKAFAALAKAERESQLHFGAAVQDDGTFRVEDVPAGTYTLEAYATPGQGSPGRASARAHTEFTVAPLAGQSDEPLNIGDVRLEPNESATRRATSRPGQ